MKVFVFSVLGGLLGYGIWQYWKSRSGPIQPSDEYLPDRYLRALSYDKRGQGHWI